MKQIRLLRPLALAMAIAGSAGVAPAHAQTPFVAASNPDADRLGQQMRVLAASPRDLSALLEAGTLSARLGDTAAALAFFARAEAVDPANPRILAGRGSALVRMERPGEALRLFQSAEARGLGARDYAADRGFAYDLLGQPALAQSDYRLALQWQRDDETLRRFAISLGITGDIEGAMRQLDPLLRRSDRAAWRARAFILAMNGDVAGAERIAANMMPGNIGQSLAPFFRRLANLSPADRAFAAHFGELSPTQARLADARLAPPLPRYVPAARPVQVAQAQPLAPAANRRRDRRGRDQGAHIAAPAVRSVAPTPVQTAAAPLPAAPRAVPRQEPPSVQPLAAPRPAPLQAPARETPPAQETMAPARAVPAPVQLASREPLPATRSVIAPPTQGTMEAAAGDTKRTAAEVAPLPTPSAAAKVPAPEPQSARAEPPALSGQEPAPAAVAAVAPASPPPAAVASPEPKPLGPARVGQEDTVLASIVAGITIPAEELETVAAPPADPAPAPAPVRAEPAPPQPKPAEAKPSTKPKPEPHKAPAATPKPETAKPATAAKPDSKGKDAKKGDTAKPDPKAKNPDPKAKKPDPKAKEPAKVEPKRVWVQVAGGANEESLAKAWKAAAAKAPVAFKGRSAWWTPLRATNRVLAGPFATAAEAQDFVNTVGKSGVSAFVFTSEAGQKVSKLAR